VTLGDALARAASYLGERGVESPRLDAELLLSKALGLSRIELYMHHDRPLTEPELAAARELVRRRGRREPLAYVLGEWGFRRLTLAVDARVLVPRPETEVVVERCLELLRGREAPAVLDVGTGSGAIALAIADEHPGARVHAVDASEDALAVARENAARAGLDVAFARRDLRDGLDGPGGGFDLVVSNPPYVTAPELAAAQPEVREWEPRAALLDEEQTEAVVRAAREVLAPGGWLVLEVAEARAVSVCTALATLGYALVSTSRDLAGRERVVEGRWEPSTTR